MHKGLNKLLKENKGFITFMILVFACRSAIADWYTVPTGSMLPTIEIGDKITVDKMAYDLKLPFTNISLMRTGEPQRGDILVFESEVADERMIKRVIGLPGDQVALFQERLVINGEPLDYTLASDETDALFVLEQLGESTHKIRLDKTQDSGLSSFAPVTVPKDHYLVMGDNRRNSADSRVYGFVPRSELKGKAHHVVWSLDYDNYYLPKAERYLTSLYSL